MKLGDLEKIFVKRLMPNLTSPPNPKVPELYIAWNVYLQWSYFKKCTFVFIAGTLVWLDFHDWLAAAVLSFLTLILPDAPSPPPSYPSLHWFSWMSIRTISLHIVSIDNRIDRNHSSNNVCDSSLMGDNGCTNKLEADWDAKGVLISGWLRAFMRSSPVLQWSCTVAICSPWQILQYGF